MVDVLSPYYRLTRTERLIAAGRLVVAAFSFLSIYLDPSGPSRYGQTGYAFLTAYMAYAALVLLLVWHAPVPPARLPITTHAVDLAGFLLLIYFTEGSTSPFYIYLIFSLICATLRWGWAGTLWTAVVAGVGFIAMGVFESLHGDHAYQLNLVVRSVYLLLATMLLGSSGLYERRLQREISRLASWPVRLPQDLADLVSEVMRNSAVALGVPRLIIVWQVQPNPAFHLATWSKGQFQWNTEFASSFQPPVAEPLLGTSFLCHNCRSSLPRVLHITPNGFRFWRGAPLNRDFQNRFAISDVVLSSALHGEYLQGRLFFLDKGDFTSDDLLLADVVAAIAAIRMDAHYLLKQLQQQAAINERVLLSHRLHDSVLQTLSTISIHVEMLQPLNENPRKARQHLAEIQRILGNEQLNMRSIVEELKETRLVPVEASNAVTQLEELVAKLERQWDTPVKLDVMQGGTWIPKTMIEGICFIILEAVAHAACHGHASLVCVEIVPKDQTIGVLISDNGSGFDLSGLYDYTAVTEMKLGPARLRARVAQLGGSLAIDSKESGTLWEINLPLKPAESNAH
jgi:signal transduction histidine kinase